MRVNEISVLNCLNDLNFLNAKLIWFQPFNRSMRPDEKSTCIAERKWLIKSDLES
jgi:hypothetical protein